MSTQFIFIPITDTRPELGPYVNGKQVVKWNNKYVTTSKEEAMQFMEDMHKAKQKDDTTEAVTMLSSLGVGTAGGYAYNRASNKQKNKKIDELNIKLNEYIKENKDVYSADYFGELKKPRIEQLIDEFKTKNNLTFKYDFDYAKNIFKKVTKSQDWGIHTGFGAIIGLFIGSLVLLSIKGEQDKVGNEFIKNNK